ncbi:MAG TPA: hypothetical protein IGS52_12740 [Oscillatoriaceae cyanobacterium M33_DOE_052]|uniref:Uncharacterized protein n=1 Tax=Planktothricoides sp. SpSt-374 TaxID=2282167 RepID=A0A7C3VRZ9_9CYAN|nr:hypothetical protein [Oscillatoriaceae cyanobacterium M33_DOE_052]
MFHNIMLASFQLISNSERISPNVRRAIVNKYKEEMTDDGGDVNILLNGQGEQGGTEQGDQGGTAQVDNG